MASSGPLSPSSAVSSSGPFVAWTAPGNALASDDARATAALSGFSAGSNPLDCTDFGFAIPSDATIDGIVVEVEKSATSTSGTPVDGQVSLFKGGVTGGDNKFSATIWPTTDAYSTYGTSSDLWGRTWTPADINATDFGLRFSGTKTAGETSTTLRVDHVRITVYYTAGGGGGTVGRIVTIPMAIFAM